MGRLTEKIDEVREVAGNSSDSFLELKGELLQSGFNEVESEVLRRLQNQLMLLNRLTSELVVMADGL